MTDLVMPGHSGPQLGAQARARARPLDVVFVTGHTDAAVLDRLPAASRVVRKPISAALLLEAVRAV